MNQDITKRDAQELPAFVPATDIVEQEDGFHIYVDMPGVPKENLSIDLKEGEVTIEGLSNYAPPAGASALHAEFGAGRFTRTFALSDAVDRNKIKAVLKDGVLNLFLPKAEAVKPRRISIESE